jgi:Ran GTPase-activating protein (RanGAP) involved in mRNA processing and transport
VALDLDYCAHGNRWRWVVGAKAMRAFSHLSLQGCKLGDTGAAHLADCETLENLRELDLAYNGIGSKGLAALAASGTLSGLRRLSLANNEGLRGIALDALRRGCPWPKLESLALSCCELDDEDARRLSRWSGLAPLKVLRLGSNHIGGPGLDAVLGAARDLEELYLDSNYGGTGMAEAVARASHLAHLRVLGLRGNDIASSGFAALAGAEHLARLQHLDLSLNTLRTAEGGSPGVRALAASRVLASLERLDLSYNTLDADAVRALVTSPLARTLTSLDLSHNCLRESGGRALLAAGKVPRLCELNLEVNDLPDGFDRAIRECGSFPSLQKLKFEPQEEKDEW